MKQNNVQAVKAHQGVSSLPKERTQALMHLIKLTQGLSALIDRESQALAHDDMVTFTILQDEKEMLSERYIRTSEEFRSRLTEFKGTDPALLNRLESIQSDLSDKAAHNNQIISRMYQKARKNTQETLITAQELGQMRPLHVPETGQHEGA